MKTLALQKGESIKFLDYVIKNSQNNDGLVLMKEKEERFGYESHLGNYGEGTQENVDSCKKYAVLYFMLARPEIFATTVVNKIIRSGSGTMSEFYKIKDVCKNESIDLPSEISCGGGLNSMIYFKGKPLN